MTCFTWLAMATNTKPNESIMACICACCLRTLYDSSPSYLSTCVPCHGDRAGSPPNQTSRPVAAFSHSAHENYTTWMLEHIAMLLVLRPMLLNMHARCENHNASFRACAFAAHAVPIHWLTRRLQLCDMLHVVGDGDKHKTECRVMPCISVCCLLTLPKHMS